MGYSYTSPFFKPTEKMFLIKKGQTNDLSVSLGPTILDQYPYFLFSFTHILSKEQYNFVPHNITTGTQNRYYEFEFIEGTPVNYTAQTPTISFEYEGQYWCEIYQQSTSGNTSVLNTYKRIWEGRTLVEDTSSPQTYWEYTAGNEDNSNFIYISDDE